MVFAKRKVLALGVTIVLLLIGAACVGCAGGASSETSSTSGSVFSPAASSADSSGTSDTDVETALSHKSIKDGFDEKTNITFEVAGIAFEAPSYYGKPNDKEIFYLEKGAGTTIVQAITSKETEVSAEEFNKAKQEAAGSYLDSLVKDGGSYKNVKTADIDLLGLPAISVTADLDLSGSPAAVKMALFLNEEVKRTGAICAIQSDASEYDYFSDFDKVIASARKVEKSEKTPTLGSTIEYDGLTIKFGEEISTTAIDNQFSEHSGDTVLCVPVTVTNGTDSSTHLNMYSVKAFGSQGTELDSVFAYFDDDARRTGDMRPGVSQDANLYFLYDGDGTYYLSFGTFKTTVEVEIPVKL